MTITRLRSAHSSDDLQLIYDKPHDHRRFGRGHGERVTAMIDVVDGMYWKTAADLSCGNGVVLNSIIADVKHYGDFAPGYPIRGPIEKTITDLPAVELFILGETLEHLDDPNLVLNQIARQADWLLMSTPIEAWGDTNGEHYWAWDRDGVEELLAVEAPSFNVVEFRTVDTRPYGEPYLFGIWLIEL